MFDFLKAANSIYSELVEHRRFLHSNPELHDHLPITRGYITEQLDKLGCEYKLYDNDSVSVTIGGAGKCILVRADADALPVKENTTLSFASKNGNSHSCGHDFHITAALGAVKLLKAVENELEGSVRFVFQSDEERVLGAPYLIERGVLEGVDAAIGMHMAAFVNAGDVVAQSGGYLASSDIFDIIVTGKGTHGSMPENGIDPILIAAKIICECQTINARLTNAFDPVVITFGCVRAGETFNIIPDKAVLSGTLRAFSDKVREECLANIERISRGVAEIYGAKAEFKLNYSTPVTYNDPELTDFSLGVARSVIGEQSVHNTSLRLKASDDFAYYGRHVPALMYHVGGGTKEQGCLCQLHNPSIEFCEGSLVNAAALYAAIPFEWLRKYGGLR